MGRAWIASVGEHKLRARRDDVISVIGDGGRFGFGGSLSVALLKCPVSLLLLLLFLLLLLLLWLL